MPLENLDLSKSAVQKWMKNLSRTRKSQAKPKTAKSVAAPSAEAAALVAAIQDARRASLETHTATQKMAEIISAPKVSTSAQGTRLVTAVQHARNASLETHAAIENIIAIMSAPTSGKQDPLPDSPRVAAFSFPQSKSHAEGMYTGKALYVRGYILQASMVIMKGLYDKILPFLRESRIRISIESDSDSKTIVESLNTFKTPELTTPQKEHLKWLINDNLYNLIKYPSRNTQKLPLIIEILYDVIPPKY